MLDSIQTEPPAAAITVEEQQTLGKDIVARIAKGDKAASKSEELYKSAGLQLIEAKKRVPDFTAFLKKHCNNLSRSRAYELIGIAGGEIEEVRAKNKERSRRHRAKKAKTKEPEPEPVSVTQRTPEVSKSEWALIEFKDAVDAYVSIMDPPTKQKALAYVKEEVARS